MKQRMRSVVAALCVGAAATAWAPAMATAQPAGRPQVPPPAPSTLVVPGDNFYPESIAVAGNGDLYVASIVTGEIVRFKRDRWTAETFVKAGVNIGTAGVLVDNERKVLWSCAIDLSFQTPTQLRAFDLASGSLVAAYTFGERGVCADIALARGDVYVTDTTDPTVSPALPGRIFRLTTPAGSAAGGDFRLWSADPAFTGPGGLEINGIAFDGRSSFYTTNYSSGTLVRVDLAADGSALPAVTIPVSLPLTNPDGIRMLDRNRLLITENPGRLTLVDVTTGEATVQSSSLDQPTSVVRSGVDLWITEGQVLRLQAGEAPNLPFKVRRLPVPPKF